MDNQGEYCWSETSILMNKAGIHLFEFERKSWFTKIGDLKVTEMEEDLLNKAFATMVAMHWSLMISAEEKNCICICENPPKKENNLQIQGDER
jgi:hypothetical protein